MASPPPPPTAPSLPGTGGGAAASRNGASADGLRGTLRALSASRREPDWLAARREEALEAYLALPLPDRVGHLWRYTDPERFLPGCLPAPQPARNGAGRVALDPADGRAGVAVLDLHRAAEARPDLLHACLGALLPPAAGKFEALNAAFWRDGILVHVPRGVEVKMPIHVSGLTGAPGGAERGGGTAVEFPRLLLVAESGSAVTVVDESAGGSQGLKVYSGVEVHAAEGASVRYVAIQRFHEGVAGHFSTRSRLGAGAKLISVLASLGGSIAKADTGTYLEGRRAEVEFIGFLFGRGKQHFDHHTVHEHRSGHTRSNLDFRVVLKDRARSAYTGLIRIAHEAPNSEAYQENRNLLLNDGAKADSIPELEILTDEVMCTHGATMGSLDPEHVFYLTSRGIPPREAARMIVTGFLEPTLSRVPEDLRERLRQHLESGLATI